jgi:demethylmenaquinone methyltransferase/2-methoxy-6-polyprenyl-1,4-benzoquinol methylase
MATAPDKSPDRIAGMFDAIAPRYDLLNHLLSAGIDRRWRAAAIRSLTLTGRETLLDVCCGHRRTWRLGRTDGQPRARVSASISPPSMLALGEAR